MAYSARLLTTDLLQKQVNQTAHGFIVGNTIRFNGTIYVAAESDTEAHGQMVGMVSNVVDANTFFVCQVGYVSAISGLTACPFTPGQLYYLSETVAGQLQTTKPVAATHVNLPCFIADSTTTGFFFASVGALLGSGIITNWQVVTTNTSMAIDNGYIINSASDKNLLLPATSAVGDTIYVANYGAGNLVVTQGAAQFQVLQGGAPSTAGAGGSIASTSQYSSATLVCVVANTAWFWMAPNGNFTVV